MQRASMRQLQVESTRRTPNHADSHLERKAIRARGILALKVLALLVAERARVRDGEHGGDLPVLTERVAGGRLGGDGKVGVAVELEGRLEGATGVEVDLGDERVVDGGRRALDDLDDGRRRDSRCGVAEGSAHEALQGRADFGAVANLPAAGVRALAHGVEPWLPHVLAHGDVEAEGTEDEDLEIVDVLERDAGDGSEGLVAVRVVLERLRKVTKVSGKLEGEKRSATCNEPCWRA